MVALILEIIIILIQLSYIFLKEQIQLLLHTSYGAIHIIKIYKYFLIVFILFEEKLKNGNFLIFSKNFLFICSILATTTTTEFQFSWEKKEQQKITKGRKIKKLKKAKRKGNYEAEILCCAIKGNFLFLTPKTVQKEKERTNYASSSQQIYVCLKKVCGYF